MITIHFTQCTENNFRRCYRCIVADEMPIIARCTYYEEQLLKDNDAIWHTFDENLILIAQYLKRNKKINCQLISTCNCKQPEQRTIPIDEDGDMTGEPHHGYFHQRLKYLR